MAILSKGTTYSDGDQVTSTNLNALVDSATFASGAVDDSTTQLSSGAIIVKDLGISAGKLATSSVTTAKIAGSNVTTAKIAAANITTSLIADSNVTKAKIENLADYKVLGNVSGGAAAPAEVAILDEDNMSSNSATSLATQQSIKAYVDTQLTAEDLDFAGDSGSSSVDLDSQTFTIAGATGLDTAASGQTLTVSLDLNELATETSIAQDDFVAMVDNTDSGNGKITFSNLEDQIFGNVSGAVAIAAGGAATVSAVTVADESSDTTCFPLFATAATGSLGPKSGSNLTFNSSTGLLTATTLSGILADGVTGTTQSSGDNSTKVATTAYVDAQVATSDALSEVLAVGNTTGSTNIVVSNGQSITTNTIAETTSGSGVTIDGVLIKDNAITASGEIDGGSLDISGNADIDGTLEADAITVNGTALATVIAGTTVTNATNSAHVLVTDNESTNEENLITFVEGATSSTGNVGLEMDGNFAYNPSTGTVSATIFKGNIDAVDGDFDGTLEADAITIGGTAIGSLFSPLAGGSDIVTTGALNSGSITSGFGSIDNGSSAITTTGVGSFGSLDISGAIDVDGTTNLDVVDIDGAVDMASTLTVAGDTVLNSDLEINVTGSSNSSKAIVINSSGTNFESDDGMIRLLHPSTGSGALTGGFFMKFNANSSDKFTVKGNGDTAIAGNIDVDGTANLDAVDIDGAVQIDSTLTVGVDDTGHDVKFFGATSGSYMQWDESLNRLIVNADGVGIKLDGSSNTTKSIFFRQTNSSNPAQVYADGSLMLFTEDNGTDIRFHVNSDGSSNEKMRINATGVGIGTAAPGSELEVKGNGAEIFINSSDSAFSRVAHQHNGTSIWTSGTRSSDDYHIFRESGSGDVIIDNGSFLVSGTALAQADSLGIDSNGIIYSARASGSATHAIFYNGSSVVGSITTSTSATAFNTSSDYRLKENETNIIDGIDRLKQLSPYRFNFKASPDETVDGFFAHEVSDVVPEAITGTKDGMKEEEYEVSPAVYEDVVHPAVDAVYEDVVHPATYEEVVHPAVEATYDEDGNELTPATEEYTEQVLLTEEYTEQVLVTESVEEWTESVLVSEAVMDTRSVPDYQGIDQSKLVPLLTAALQEAVSKIEALESRVQTLEG